MKTFKERQEDVLKKHIMPFLKTRGFRQKGNNFIRYGKELAYSFFVIRDKPHDTHASFGIHLEFFVKNFEEKENPLIYRGALFTVDIQSFTDKKSWNAEFRPADPNPEEHDAEIRDYFIKTIDEKAIPFSETIESLQDIIHLLETTPEEARFWHWPPHPVIFRYLATLYWILGQKEKAIEAIDKGLEERAEKYRTNHVWLENHTKYRERILKGGDFYTQEPPPPSKKRTKKA